ncbi:tyrosine-type recombinase/integrase [Streptomyces sp. NPDC050704]|uniref:tyrosine-type recombinase/integrase n=1 Tax=Streptomyces sp. NPDC050704 TaxID=3157219 RepID=UPI00342B9CC2
MRHLGHEAGTIPHDPDRLLDLADVLDVLPDPRRRQGRRYRLGPVLALCTIVVLAGATTLATIARHAAYLPDEVRHCLGLRAAPRATMFGRLLARLDGVPDDPLLCSHRGDRLSPDAVARLVARHTATAAMTCVSLRTKHVTPHTLRHTAAMALLHAGADTSVIALWLGHESQETSMIYLHADMTLKERALARTTPPDSKPGRYTAPDAVFAFLDSL